MSSCESVTFYLGTSQTTGDRRHDRDLIVRRDRGVEVLQEADVVAVYVDVDEAPHPPIGLAQTLLDARIAALHVGDDLADRRALRGDLFGAPGELAKRGGNSNLGHSLASSFGIVIAAPAPSLKRRPLGRSVIETRVEIIEIRQPGADRERLLDGAIDGLESLVA